MFLKPLLSNPLPLERQSRQALRNKLRCSYVPANNQVTFRSSALQQGSKSPRHFNQQGSISLRPDNRKLPFRLLLTIQLID